MDFKMVRQILAGLASYVRPLRRAKTEVGGSDDARYCYSVWMRHLVLAHKSKLPTRYDVIAELGPGGSLGMGLAGLLSGARKYTALDIVPFANCQRNVMIFDALVEMFRKREPIPGPEEFPLIRPALNSYEFPRDILTEDMLVESLRDERIAAIRAAIADDKNMQAANSPVRYCVPWNDPRIIEFDSVDVIFTQAVLEHVDALRETYEAMHKWLKAGGFMSHMIDFSCHKEASRWNGHWAYSDLTWRLIVGRQTYLINRQPLSVHLRLLEETGFKLLRKIPCENLNGIRREQLAPRFAGVTDEDLRTEGAFLQAVRT